MIQAKKGNVHVKQAEALLWKVRVESCQSIQDRFVLLMEFLHDGHGFWQRLGEQAGVHPSVFSRSAALKRYLPLEALEAVARVYPQYAFWLVHGATPESYMRHKIPLKSK